MAHGGLARWTALTGAILGLVTAPAVAGAATRHAAGYGVDVAGCGSLAAPCRTIDQAIAHAAPGDTVTVGPGRYPSTAVTKRLTLVSSRGAAFTTIDAAGRQFGIDILASEVVIGRPARGFTITGAAQAGIHASDVSRVTITGNSATGNHDGIAIGGGDIADVEVSGNVASHNTSTGIRVSDAAGAEIVETSSRATGNTASPRTSSTWARSAAMP